MRERPVRHGAWNAQFDFRARAYFAPHFESPADLFSALAHARQTPMSVASRLQEVRVNAFSIIPDTQSKKTFAVGDIRFDFTCLGVAERISQRLPRNTINVVSENRMQVPRFALYGNPECRRGAPAIPCPGEPLMVSSPPISRARSRIPRIPRDGLPEICSSLIP